MVRVALTITRDLLEEVDRVVQAGKYKSRSELAREAIRQLLARLRGGGYDDSSVMLTDGGGDGAYDAYEYARALLRQFVLHALRSSRYRANVRRSDSPVVLSLGMFRQFVWEAAMHDARLRPHTVTLNSRRCGKRADLIGGRKLLSPTAIAWAINIKSILEELRLRGLIEDYWRVGRNYFVKPKTMGSG